MNRTGNSIFSRQWQFIALGVSWLTVQSIIFYIYGIHTDLEAAKYIHEAQLLLNEGRVSTPNYWLYSTQIFLIAIALKLNTGFFSVYLVQLLFNALATIAFYRLLIRMSNPVTAFVLTLVLICCIPIQTFNAFLQTDSLFYSFTILFSCYLLRIERLTFRTSLAILLFLFLICFTRPTGIVFIPGTLLYLLFKFARNLSAKAKWGIAITGAILFLVALNMALGSGGELDFMLPFREEHIICGVPAVSQSRDINVADTPNSIWGLLYYITHNTEQFMKLAWLKTKAFFGIARPYYSQGHNVYLWLYFFPFYALALLSVPKWLKANRYILLYCITMIIVTWLTVILTCDDWHNRFFLGIAPYIFILSAPMIMGIKVKRAI